MATILNTVLFLITIFHVYSGATLPRLIGEISLQRAAFINLYTASEKPNPKDKYTLMITNFNPSPFSEDNVYYVESIGRKLEDIESIEVKHLTSDVLWPRKPSQVKYEIFGLPTVSLPCGFLVPGRHEGAVRILDVSDLELVISHDITREESSQKMWFFHGVIWKDMNGDGRPDAVTNRARVPKDTGKPESEFVWLQHPADGDPLSKTWGVHVINRNIGDTYLASQWLIAGTTTFEVIFTVGYFSQKLAVHWTVDPDGRWENNTDVRTRIIDEGCRFFDVYLEDINNDGQKDVLTICNAQKNGAVVAYEIPSDFRTGQYVKRILASGFDTTSEDARAGTPGSLALFHPDTRVTSGKPHIALSGDSSGKVIILNPLSDDPAEWRYNQTLLLDAGDRNIMGGPSTADVDGDGYTEIFFPSFYQNAVHIFTYKPSD